MLGWICARMRGKPCEVVVWMWIGWRDAESWKDDGAERGCRPYPESGLRFTAERRAV